jgi:hypothetical protein
MEQLRIAVEWSCTQDPFVDKLRGCRAVLEGSSFEESKRIIAALVLSYGDDPWLKEGKA